MPLLRALQRPDRELAMRLVTPDGMARVTVIRQGAQCISARRVGNEIAVDVVEGPASLPRRSGRCWLRCPWREPLTSARSARRWMPPARRCPAHTMRPLLSDRIRALGAEPRTAMLLGSAFASRLAFAEIVYYTLDGDEDRISRCPAAVGVFYTKRGRIVAAPQRLPQRPIVDDSESGLGSRHRAGDRPACRAFRREMGGLLAVLQFGMDPRRTQPERE